MAINGTGDDFPVCAHKSTHVSRYLADIAERPSVYIYRINCRPK